MVKWGLSSMPPPPPWVVSMVFPHSCRTLASSFTPISGRKPCFPPRLRALSPHSPISQALPKLDRRIPPRQRPLRSGSTRPHPRVESLFRVSLPLGHPQSDMISGTILLQPAAPKFIDGNEIGFPCPCPQAVVSVGTSGYLSQLAQRRGATKWPGQHVSNRTIRHSQKSTHCVH